jgi:hypothetical protein
MNQNHLHTEDRQIPQDHQWELIQPWTRITHILRTGKFHKTFSKSSCSPEPGALTYWGQANVTRPLARVHAAMNQDHLLAEDKQMPQTISRNLCSHEPEITYILRTGKCSKIISKSSCSHEPRSRTAWKQANATRPSARAHAAMNQDHLLAEDRQMPQDHQQEPMQPWTRNHLHTENR